VSFARARGRPSRALRALRAGAMVLAAALIVAAVCEGGGVGAIGARTAQAAAAQAAADTAATPTGIGVPTRPAGPPAAPARSDTLAPVVGPVLRPVLRTVFAASPFDSISQRSYLQRHAFSLDHFMEREPGFVLGRFGPIGKDVLLSRYGFGSGRAEVFFDDVPVNDPQNDVAPLADLPVSGMGMLLEGAATGAPLVAPGGLEGRVRFVEAEPDPIQPSTFIEASKGENDLRQRRVWFGTMQGSAGLDLGYDELLNEGYGFDARSLEGDEFISDTDFGKCRSRYLTMNVRGKLDDGDAYRFSFRRFTASSQGDLVSASSRQQRDGHLAIMAADLGRFRLRLFSRGYDAEFLPTPESAPDSSTSNLTGAGNVHVRLLGDRNGALSLGVGFEEIHSSQVVGGAESHPLLRRSTASLVAERALPGRFSGRVEFGGTNPQGMTGGWGGEVAVAKEIGPHAIGVYVGRRYRMPNLGELFLPVHNLSSGNTLSGNRYLEPEYGGEVGGRLTIRLGPLVNELRVLTLRVENPIMYLPRSASPPTWRVAENGASERMGVVEDRFRLEAHAGGFLISAAASAAWTTGDREAYFRAVPETDVRGSLRVGRELFKATSALSVGADYAYRSSRSGFTGGTLSAYHVFDFKAEGRLLDANMYVVLLNAFDEGYETIDGYLMTPRTFVYGISWRLFD